MIGVGNVCIERSNVTVNGDFISSSCSPQMLFCAAFRKIILVFDLADPDNIARAVQGENVGTLVYEG